MLILPEKNGAWSDNLSSGEPCKTYGNRYCNTALLTGIYGTFTVFHRINVLNYSSVPLIISDEVGSYGQPKTGAKTT